MILPICPFQAQFMHHIDLVAKYGEYSHHVLKWTISRLQSGSVHWRRVHCQVHHRHVDVLQIGRAELVRQASRYLSTEDLEIFRVQLYLQRQYKHGRRWPDSFKPCGRIRQCWQIGVPGMCSSMEFGARPPVMKDAISGPISCRLSLWEPSHN